MEAFVCVVSARRVFASDFPPLSLGTLLRLFCSNIAPSWFGMPCLIMTRKRRVEGGIIAICFLWEIQWNTRHSFNSFKSKLAFRRLIAEWMHESVYNKFSFDSYGSSNFSTWELPIAGSWLVLISNACVAPAGPSSHYITVRVRPGQELLKREWARNRMRWWIASGSLYHSHTLSYCISVASTMAHPPRVYTRNVLCKAIHLFFYSD